MEVPLTTSPPGAAGGSSTFVTLTVTSIVSSVVGAASIMPSASSRSVTPTVIVYSVFVSKSNVVLGATVISPVRGSTLNESMSSPLSSSQISVSPSRSVAPTVPTVAASALFSAIMNVTSSPSSNSGDVSPGLLVAAFPENAAAGLPTASASGFADGTA